MAPAVDANVRAARAKQSAEIFTPPKLVKQMLDKLPKVVWRKGKTFCDPAVGNGNFLIAILIRKIERGHNPLQALSSVYGADIMGDNIRECRLRLLKVVELYGEKILRVHVVAVMKNIVWTNPKKFPNGSLDYDFNFDVDPKESDVQMYLEWINKRKILDQVVLPVREDDSIPKGDQPTLFKSDVLAD